MQRATVGSEGAKFSYERDVPVHGLSPGLTETDSVGVRTGVPHLQENEPP